MKMNGLLGLLLVVGVAACGGEGPSAASSEAALDETKLGTPTTTLTLDEKELAAYAADSQCAPDPKAYDSYSSYECAAASDGDAVAKEGTCTSRTICAKGDKVCQICVVCKHWVPLPPPAGGGYWAYDFFCSTTPNPGVVTQ